MAAFNENTLTLITKEYPEGGNIFTKIASWFKKYDESKIKLYDPMETILRILKTTLKIPYSRKMVRGIDPKNDVYGEYPKLMVNHCAIPKEKIINALMEFFPLDMILDPDQKEIAEEIEYLCINKLHVATQYCYCYSEEAKQFPIVSGFISPIKTFTSVRLRFKYENDLGTVLNIHSEAEAHAVAQSVHDVLAKHLINKNFLLSEEHKEINKTTLTFADIIAYAFLKEELMLTPDSPAAESLKTNVQYAGIRQFITNFEKALEKDTFTGDFVPLTVREVNKIGEKYALKPEIQSPYADYDASQEKSENQKQVATIREVTVVTTVAAFVAFLNLY